MNTKQATAPLHETVSTASVMGYEFAAQVIARVKNQPERDLVRDLSRDLERRYRLVFEQPETRLGAQVLSPYRFSHALVRQYLYDELGAAERRQQRPEPRGADPRHLGQRQVRR